MLLDAAPPKVHLGGSARARVSASGKLVRTRMTASIPKIDLLPVVSGTGAYVRNVIATDTALILVSAGSMSRSASGDGGTFTMTASGLNAAIAARGTIIGGVGTVATATGNIRRSIDNGATWSTPTLPTAASWYTVGTNGDGTWIATDSAWVTGVSVIRSTDDGVTWSATPNLPSGRTYGWAGVSYLNGVWVASAPYSGGVYSTDDGGTWKDTGSQGFVKAAGNYFFSFNDNGTNYFQMSIDGKGWWLVYGPAKATYNGVTFYKGLYYFSSTASGLNCYTRDFSTWNEYGVGINGGNDGVSGCVYNDMLVAPINSTDSYIKSTSDPYTTPLQEVTE